MIISNKGAFDSEMTYVTCVCGNHDHMLIFAYDNNVDGYIVFKQLNHYMGFFKRLYHGVRYIFGKRSKHVHFTETCISASQFESLMLRLADHRKMVLENEKSTNVS